MSEKTPRDEQQDVLAELMRRLLVVEAQLKALCAGVEIAEGYPGAQVRVRAEKEGSVCPTP